MLLVVAVFSAAPARASTMEELCAAGRQQMCEMLKDSAAALESAKKRPQAPREGRECLPGWEKRGERGCWAGEHFVHPAGWLVERRCFADSRFTAAQLKAALDMAARKMSPDVPASGGGCLADYNPDWARELRSMMRAKSVYVTCPPFAAGDHFCADEGAPAGLPDARVITMRNVRRCLEGQDPVVGLAATFFHETLHADEADNFPTAVHNAAGDLPQYKFIHDRIYAAEMVCMRGTDPARRAEVNLFQCHETVSYRSEHPRKDLCRGFNTVFYDTYPPGLLKH